ncbi:hypothetical protein M899_3442 [Bacteriovorax sp. BSW11_IV]|uniref:hypothetical protein n=1 Tax=Bacteriovorax sp. BSW11_IV TaxID=1353529 RepID=UPI00038A3872|nr:hypothetical protein [Bacteriovorax sp. BSW11_IV]EQC45145.1 hypothetical protein M899_3442 [Bacteriovorax sp. BSW11_IV]
MAATNILMDIFRLLTPEEINKLTTSSIGDKRVSLTEMMTRYDHGEIPVSEEGAKILPFKKPGAQEEVVEEEKIRLEFFAGAEVQKYLDHYFEKAKINESYGDAKSSKFMDTASFIINEKKRFNYSQTKLKGAEVLKLYRKNSSVDIEQERKLKDDMSKSAQVGVLVNKKQY